MKNQMLSDHRRAMKSCGDKKMIEKHFQCACALESDMHPKRCMERDCRYCFLEREKNDALDRLSLGVTINVYGGNVKIFINGKEAR